MRANTNVFYDHAELSRAIGVLQGALGRLAETIADDEAYLEGLLDSRAKTLGQSLTKVELKIAARVAREIPTSQIALDREVSKKTVQNQISEAMPKLGFNGCRELQGWIRGIASMMYGAVVPTVNGNLPHDSYPGQQ